MGRIRTSYTSGSIRGNAFIENLPLLLRAVHSSKYLIEDIWFWIIPWLFIDVDYKMKNTYFNERKALTRKRVSSVRVVP